MATNQKTAKVKLAKTVQVEPGKPALAPGEHEVSADLAEELKKAGLTVEPKKELETDK
tara:strand:+ start:91 stop:264 length:174 start_codon:yes stop_codon:yes gene_type:complete